MLHTVAIFYANNVKCLVICIRLSCYNYLDDYGIGVKFSSVNKSLLTFLAKKR